MAPGLPYQDMRPDLVAVVDYATGKQLEGPLKPASELYLRTLAVSSPKILSDEQIAAVARKIRDTGYGQHVPAEKG